MKGNKARRLLRKLDYLPRWAWYLLSLLIAGPIGPLTVYLVFYVLGRAAQDESEDETVYRDATTYADEDCVVTDDEEVARQWRRTEESAERARPQRDEEAADEGEESAVADVIREGREALRRMRRADAAIADPKLSAQIVSIEESCEQILSILAQRPQVLGELRTFLRYYLPTTLRLLDARAKLENASTPRAIQVSARISEAVEAVDKAFKKQLEALDEYRFIDLESEMDVLRDMLKADGLVDEEKEDDPFADVMNKRNRGGKPLGGH